MPSFAKFFGRTGTRSKFGKTPERNLPAVTETAVEIRDQDESSEKKDKQKTDEEVGVSEDKKEIERAGVKTNAKGKTTVRKNVASDKEGTSSSGAAKNIFAKYWATVLTHSMTAVTFTDRVWYMPNAMGLMTIINIYLPLVARSNWIEKHETTFNPYAAACALCFIYYIQILRAKEAAGALNGNETSILTRFRKAFPEEKIEIPGVFVPYFESIVATEPSDNKYPWIVPHYGDLSSFTAFDEFHAAGAVNYLRPLLPLMLANLASFGAIRPTDLPNHIDESGTYRAISLHPANNANAVHVLNQDFDFTAATAAPAQPAAQMTDEMTVFLMSGMNIPFQFFNDNAAAAQRDLRRSNFYGAEGIDVSIIQGQTFGGANLAQTRNCHTLETFLFAEKNKSLHWADYLFNHLAIAAKHSTDNKNLSEIATTGGMESTVLCSLRTAGRRAIAGTNRYVYENTHLGLADSSAIDWYRNDRFRNMTGYFRTPRADVEREEELQAFVFGINAAPPIHNFARANVTVSGSFFNHALNAGGAEDAMTYSEHGNEENTVPGPVHMYEGWEQNVIRPSFLNKPAGM